MPKTICLEPIGTIRSPYRKCDDAPNQGREGGAEGELLIGKRFQEALLGLQPGQRILILYFLHLAERDRLQVHPRSDRTRPLRGVFSTRSPHRPNPIAVDVVEILSIDGTTLKVKGLDAVDGTPLLDIKCEM